MSNTAALYGPNDFHLVPAVDAYGEPILDHAGKLAMIAKPGLGPEADAILMQQPGTRSERAAIAAERAQLEQERALFEEEKATLARELASHAASSRKKSAHAD